MTATLTMVPLAQIKPSEGFNPRSDFDEEQMAELVASVKRHGIITPLTLTPDGDGGFTIVAGERRYRAAKAAKLREVPAQVRDADGDALSLAIAENVIRADLNPLEEARAYRRLVDEHGDAGKVAKLVGKREKLICDRLDLLRLPEQAQALLAARRLPLACAPVLVQIAEARAAARRPLRGLACGTAARGGRLPSRSGRGHRRRARRDLDGRRRCGRSTRSPTASAATTARSCRPARRSDMLAAVVAKLGTRGDGGRHRVRRPAEDRPSVRVRLGSAAGGGAPAARVLRAHRRGRRRSARVRLPSGSPQRRTGAASTRTSPIAEWLADRLVQKIAAHAAAEAERKHGASEKRAPVGRPDDPEREARRQERERQYEARVSGRARNLDLGAALARWEPKIDTDAVKLLGSLVLLHYGKAAAWAQRLCVEQPTTTNKQGKVTVRYPRGAQAEKQLHEQATAALMRARTPEAALAVVLRLLVAQRLADTDGLPNADRQGDLRAAGAGRLEGASTSSPAASRRPRSSSTWPSGWPSANGASRPARERGGRADRSAARQARRRRARSAASAAST